MRDWRPRMVVRAGGRAPTWVLGCLPNERQAGFGCWAIGMVGVRWAGGCEGKEVA